MYPKPELFILKFAKAPFEPMIAVAEGQHPAGQAKVALPELSAIVGGTE